MRILVYISGTIASMSIVFGTLFKLLHLPGADQLLMIGMSLLGFIFIPLAAIYLYRKRK